MCCARPFRHARHGANRAISRRWWRTLSAGFVLALAAIAGLAISSGPARAGAWTRESGGSFLKLGYDRWFSDQRFDSDGHRVAFQEPRSGFDDEAEYRNHALRFYGEYGYSETLTLIGSTALEFLESERHGRIDRAIGLSDVRVQLKQRLLQSPVVVSVSAEAKIPSGYDTSKPPALGTGAADGGGRLAIGGSLGLVYLTGEAGYVVRGGGRLDHIPFALELGYSLSPDVMVIGELRGATTFDAVESSSQQPDGPDSGPAFDPAVADSRSLSAAAALVLRGRPLDIVLQLEHMVAGENTLAGTRLSLSVWRLQ